LSRSPIANGKSIWPDFDVTNVDPSTTVQWRFTDGPPEWIGTDVTFDVSRQGEHTILVFGHRNGRQALSRGPQDRQLELAPAPPRAPT
jgi:hypothetical protein